MSSFFLATSVYGYLKQQVGKEDEEHIPACLAPGISGLEWSKHYLATNFSSSLFNASRINPHYLTKKGGELQFLGQTDKESSKFHLALNLKRQ